MTSFLGFERDIPAPLLFIEPSEKQVHLLVKEFVGMGLVVQAVRALTNIDLARSHDGLHLWKNRN